MIVIRRRLLPFYDHGMPGPCIPRKHLFLNNLPRQVVLQTTTNKAENQAQALASEENEKSNKTIEHQHHSRTHFQRAPIHCDETDESVSIALDVPGFGADDLKVSLEDHVLSLFGKRRNRIGDTFIVHHRFSLNKSTFDEESIKANLSGGVLEISVHKKPEPKARLIPISTEAAKAPVVDTKDVNKKADPTSKKDDEDLTVLLGPHLHEDTEATPDTTVAVETVEGAEEEEEEETVDTKAAEYAEKNNVSATKVVTEEEEEDTWEAVTHSN
jgi:HSP20 family molecular chaperone IbpA